MCMSYSFIGIWPCPIGWGTSLILLLTRQEGNIAFCWKSLTIDCSLDCWSCLCENIFLASTLHIIHFLHIQFYFYCRKAVVILLDRRTGALKMRALSLVLWVLGSERSGAENFEILEMKNLELNACRSIVILLAWSALWRKTLWNDIRIWPNLLEWTPEGVSQPAADNDADDRKKKLGGLKSTSIGRCQS